MNRMMWTYLGKELVYLQREGEGLPWWSSGEDSALPWVRPFVGELRSCMLLDEFKK